MPKDLKNLYFSFGNDSSLFQPRPAYNSFVGAFLQKGYRKKYGIKRLDFAFYPQIASNRPVGGTAMNALLETLKYVKLYEKYEVNEKTKLSPAELRPLLEKKLQRIR